MKITICDRLIEIIQDKDKIILSKFCNDQNSLTLAHI